MTSVDIKSKKELFAKLNGEHKSSFGGSGIEFLDIREYTPNESARHINWKRSQPYSTPLVNIYSDERELNIVVVYLVSGSLEFANKRAIAKDAFATLCYSASVSKERLNMLLFAEDTIAYYEGLRGDDSFDLAYDLASETTHLGKDVNYRVLLDFLLNNLDNNSIIFSIGDFLDATENILELNYNHELYLVVVRDRVEESIDSLKSGRYLDPVDLTTTSIELDRFSKIAYNREFKRRDKALFNLVESSGIEYKKLYNKESVVERLQEFWS